MIRVKKTEKKNHSTVISVISDRFLEQTGLHVTKSPFALKKMVVNEHENFFGFDPLIPEFLTF